MNSDRQPSLLEKVEQLSLTSKLLLPSIVISVFILCFEINGTFPRLSVNAREWTGFGEDIEEKATYSVEKIETRGNITTKTSDISKRESEKTLWDWMNLLLAPATLAGLSFWFQDKQESVKRDREKTEQEQNRKQEQLEKERAEDKQREDALQTYFDRLSDLLINQKVALLLAQEDFSHDTTVTVSMVDKGDENEVSFRVTDDIHQEVKRYPESAGKEAFHREDCLQPTIADTAKDIIRARTLSLLRMLKAAKDSARQASVISFLAEANLVSNLRIDLRESILRQAYLPGVKLKGASLSYADFTEAILIRADFSYAYLNEAEFHEAKLTRANLTRAVLKKAKLIRADLIRTNLSGADLSNADLSYSDIRDSDLRGANLTRTNLTGAILLNANLTGSNLENAILDDAQFENTNLTDITNWSLEQLSEAKLYKVTLPSGCDLHPSRDREIFEDAANNDVVESYA
ncbi:MAG: pentapeptide repeat-containing protein [Drouetiella hepatica Uher 2000/2452]|jgi:uncharacterized protein YjbI with pentapeptide repeats|uniref:Pentapeptide repeat-containing protein n=1 Tax=Drouetiella hepatica Uher 2000/2452 TaxID=904376 RepID=A0A951UNK6_9CYAN|nr:pentapeptide repeat-containing protein [Drouetiella hepatica Uher 2000/2452]